MVKEKTIEIPISKDEFDELTEQAKKLGFKSLDEFAVKAVRRRIAEMKNKFG